MTSLNIDSIIHPISTQYKKSPNFNNNYNKLKRKNLHNECSFHVESETVHRTTTMI